MRSSTTAAGRHALNHHRPPRSQVCSRRRTARLPMATLLKLLSFPDGLLAGIRYPSEGGPSRPLEKNQRLPDAVFVLSLVRSRRPAGHVSCPSENALADNGCTSNRLLAKIGVCPTVLLHESRCLPETSWLKSRVLPKVPLPTTRKINACPTEFVF